MRSAQSPCPPQVLPKGELSQIELEHAEAKAPDLTGVFVVGTVIQISFDLRRAHIGHGVDRGVAGVHDLSGDSSDAKSVILTWWLLLMRRLEGLM